MKKKLKIAWKELLTNRGSGLAYVMMAMVLLSLLATTLLNMTYMGYKIKAEDRKQKEDYYIATTAMDEIRAGLQVTVSNAIAEAYKNILVNRYNPEDTDALQSDFQNIFFMKVEGRLKHDLPEKYESDKLKDMIKNHARINISDGRLDIKDTEFILYDISLKYENSAGNEFLVKTDIVISAPDFSPSDGWNYDKLVQYRNWSINKWTE